MLEIYHSGPESSIFYELNSSSSHDPDLLARVGTRVPMFVSLVWSRNSSLVVCWARCPACCGVVGSILL